MKSPTTLKALAAGLLSTAMGMIPLAALAVEAVDHITVSLPAPTQSIDPTGSVSATDRAFYSLTNGTLYRTQIDGSIVPGLADSIAFNDDFSVATVTLRSGLKFSDGTPITGNDVAATFMRHKAVEGSVLGAMMNRITSVKATGDLSAEFTFTGPFPSFTDFASSGAYGIYPADRVTEAGFFEAPVTSGPYKFTDGWSSNKIELVANENFGGPKPAAAAVTLSIIEDANSAISQLQAGQLDYAGDLPPNFISQLQGAPGITVTSVPVYGFYDLRMWNPSGILSDVNIRKAISLALDRNAIVRSIWGESNQPLAGFWPQSMAWYASVSTEQDIDGAKALLAGTECADGCSVRMMYSDQEFAFSSQLALVVQNQLKAVGIDLQLERLDAATLVQRLRAGDYDLVPGAMAAPANIPDPLLANALLGTGPLKAEFTGYNSEKMNTLVARVNESADEERAAAASELEALFAEDAPYATLAPWVRVGASRLAEGAVSLVGTGIVVGDLTE
jgi:peptide/nickel transport system substrate-binding protein